MDCKEYIEGLKNSLVGDTSLVFTKQSFNIKFNTKQPLKCLPNEIIRVKRHAGCLSVEVNRSNVKTPAG